MNMKFKKGDKVKLKQPCSGSIPGVVYTLRSEDGHGDTTDTLWAWNAKSADRGGCSCEDNFILLTKMAKVKTVKYILKYDESDTDPYEEFATLDNVKKRIEELISEGASMIMSSVRVYEVKSIAKVETQIIFK